MLMIPRVIYIMIMTIEIQLNGALYYYLIANDVTLLSTFTSYNQWRYYNFLPLWLAVLLVFWHLADEKFHMW